MDLHDLYTRHATDVRRFALYLCGSELLADDLTSETFLRAWCSSSPIRETTVKSYLFTIVRNLYLTELRRTSRQRALVDSVASDAPTQDQIFEFAATMRGPFALTLLALGFEGWQIRWVLLRDSPGQALILMIAAFVSLASYLAMGRKLRRSGR
jgi:RNA polymerase sigma factor (sigma-70 family)